MEKPGKHHVIQVTMVHITSDTMWTLHILCYDVVRIHLWCSCQIPELQSNHEKNISQIQIEKNSTKCQTNIPQDCQNHEKHGRNEDLS